MRMPTPEHRRKSPYDFDRFANEVAMAVWNRIAELPEFHHLKPKDYPSVYEALQNVLRPYALTKPFLFHRPRKW
jgi:hypothetical protein